MDDSFEVFPCERAFDESEQFDLGCLGHEAGQVWIVIESATSGERRRVCRGEMEKIPRRLYRVRRRRRRELGSSGRWSTRRTSRGVSYFEFRRWLRSRTPICSRGAFSSQRGQLPSLEGCSHVHARHGDDVGAPRMRIHLEKPLLRRGFRKSSRNSDPGASARPCIRPAENSFRERSTRSRSGKPYGGIRSPPMRGPRASPRGTRQPEAMSSRWRQPGGRGPRRAGSSSRPPSRGGTGRPGTAVVEPGGPSLLTLMGFGSSPCWSPSLWVTKNE